MYCNTNEKPPSPKTISFFFYINSRKILEKLNFAIWVVWNLKKKVPRMRIFTKYSKKSLKLT